MKICIVLLVLVFSSVAFAEHHMLKTNDLIEEQVAQLRLQAAQMKSERPIVEQAQEWANVADAIGNGVGKAAENLGVAANEFINTPVGKMTAFVIVYKFIGSELIRIVISGTIWIIIVFILNSYLPICLLYYPTFV